VTLFFVWTAMALAPVFPLVPWFWSLLLLQVVNDGALSFAWSGSQTLIAQLTEREAEYIGRFSRRSLVQFSCCCWRRRPLRGWLQGAVQPVMFSVQAKAVGRYRQGSVDGLRQTMNRMAAIVIPPTMGAIADQWGARSSFLIRGTVLLALSAPVALITRRATRLAAAGPLPQSQSPQTEVR
jgi:hypothetical protein